MFCSTKQKLLITSPNSVYEATVFIQKPSPKFCSAKRYAELLIHAYVIQNVAPSGRSILDNVLRLRLCFPCVAPSGRNTSDNSG